MQVKYLCVGVNRWEPSLYYLIKENKNRTFLLILLTEDFSHSYQNVGKVDR